MTELLTPPPSLAVPAAAWVHFAEWRGDPAPLRTCAQAWAALPGYLGGELLHSPAQADERGELYLLVTRWSTEPALQPPLAAKAWAFQVVA